MFGNRASKDSSMSEGSILDSYDELQVAEMINVSKLAKRSFAKDIQVMIKEPDQVPLNEVTVNVRLASSLIISVPYYLLGF